MQSCWLCEFLGFVVVFFFQLLLHSDFTRLSDLQKVFEAPDHKHELKCNNSFPCSDSVLVCNS